MRRRQTAGQAYRDADRARRRQRPLDPVEGLAAHELGDQIRVPPDFADAVDSDHVGVGEACNRPRLGEELLAHARIRADRRDELHRHQSVQQRVVGQIDLPHAAASEGPHDPVLLEFGWGGERPAHPARVAPALAAEFARPANSAGRFPRSLRPRMRARVGSGVLTTATSAKSPVQTRRGTSIPGPA